MLDRDLLPGQHVQVALGRGLEPPRLARADLVERQLHVLAQVGLGLRLARLVVDQLVGAVGEAVDPVDPPPKQVRPDPEGEAAFEPDGRRLLGGEALVVALERGESFLVELALLVGIREPEPPPARLEEGHEPLGSGLGERHLPRRLLVGEVRVVALEHLVDEDPEPLLKGLLARDREHPREFVAERA